MNFLKKPSPQETAKTVPKPRIRDRRRSKEVEDIEGFFLCGKPNATRLKEPDRDTSNLPKHGSQDSRDRHAQTQSPRISSGRRATTYSSLSNGGHCPTRQERHPNTRSAESVLPPVSPPSSPTPREQNQTPEHVWQNLVKTGVFRVPPTPEQHESRGNEALEESSFDRHDSIDEISWNPRNVVSAEAFETQKHPGKQAWVMEKGLLSQLREHPSQPPARPGSLRNGTPGAQRVPSSLFRREDPRHLPSDRSQTQWTVPMDPTAALPANCPSSGQLRPGVVVPRPKEPSSILRHDDPAVIPRPAIRPQSRHSFRRMATTWDAGWLLNTSPHNHDLPYQSSSRHRPPSLAHRPDMTPEAYAREHAISHPRQAGQESVHNYVCDLEQEVLEPDHGNDPSSAHSLDTGHQQRYLSPFLRHGPAPGCVPAVNEVATERGSWMPQSYRQSGRSEDGQFGMALQHALRQPLDHFHRGRQDENAVEKAQPVGRWKAG